MSDSNPETRSEPGSTGEHSLEDWRRIWESDEPFPVTSHRGWLGKPIVWLKKVLRAIVRAPQADLWDRQRVYNLRLQTHMEQALKRLAENHTAVDDAAAVAAGAAEHVGAVEKATHQVGRDLQQVQGELVADHRALSEALTRTEKQLEGLADEVYGLSDRHFEYLQAHEKRIERVEGIQNRGWDDSMDHTTALFSRLDQKLDRYRDLSRERWHRLGALLEIARSRGAEGLERAVDDQSYVEFEALFRGREEDIGARLAPYLPIVSGRGDLLDLGCGRGEALEVFTAHGIRCSGVDSNSEMVERCREKGLEAEVGDLFESLAARPEESLGVVASFHVIEHLPAAALEGLVRRAWRVLKPGGVLVFETPSPLSLVVGARNFWLDPTHARPVHPDSLKAIFALAGFDPVERLDLQPFGEEERLPEVDTGDLAPELAPLAERVHRLRDRLDALLFGFQDFGLVGYKPGKPGG